MILITYDILEEENYKDSKMAARAWEKNKWVKWRVKLFFTIFFLIFF